MGTELAVTCAIINLCEYVSERDPTSRKEFMMFLRDMSSVGYVVAVVGTVVLRNGCSCNFHGAFNYVVLLCLGLGDH